MNREDPGTGKEGTDRIMRDRRPRHGYSVFRIAAVLVTAASLLCACSKEARMERELRTFALDLMEDGAYGAAIAKFDEALSKSGGRIGTLEVDILKYRAECEMAAGEYDAAEYTYRLLEENDRKKNDYTDLRAICLARGTGDVQEALKLYRKSQESETASGTPVHREALYALGERLSAGSSGQDTETVKELYRAALEDERMRTGELYNRMAMLVHGESLEEAIEWFEKGLEYIRESGNAEAENETRKAILFNLGVCYEENGRYEKALTQFREYEESFGSTEASAHEIRFLEGILSER